MPSALSELSEERKNSSYMLIDSTGPLVPTLWLSEIIFNRFHWSVKAEVSPNVCIFGHACIAPSTNFCYEQPVIQTEVQGPC